jgi:3-polyprenyl-4-hydroxybenzoate decarboxylase
MAYFKDVREHLSALETAGLLVRIECEVKRILNFTRSFDFNFAGWPRLIESVFVYQCH